MMQGGPGGGAGPWASKDHAILAGAGFSCVKKGARVTPCPFCIQEGVGCRDPVGAQYYVPLSLLADPSTGSTRMEHRTQTAHQSGRPEDILPGTGHAGGCVGLGVKLRPTVMSHCPVSAALAQTWLSLMPVTALQTALSSRLPCQALDGRSAPLCFQYSVDNAVGPLQVRGTLYGQGWQTHCSK